MIKNWKILHRWQLFKNRFISMRVDCCELPDGRVMPDYYVLDFADWVQVIALTPTHEMVMVRQYRHGIEKVLLEIPGGATHPGVAHESPLLAAQRELREETGFFSTQWTHLGSHSPNPALQSNMMHVYLAEDCIRMGEPDLDPYEDLEVELLPVSEVFQLAESGKMIHALVLAGLLLGRSHPKIQQSLKNSGF